MQQHYRDELLARHLKALLGEVDPAAIDVLRRSLEWVEIGGGQTLMHQGEPGDSMYLTISGRLRAYVITGDGARHTLREMGRGQIIGEMSLYTGAPRSATVIAIRDSVLVRLPKSQWSTIIASSPQLSIALTRQIIERLQTPRQSELARPVTIALIPISKNIDVQAFGARLAAELARAWRISIVDAASIDRDLQQLGIARSDDGDTEATRRVAMHLDATEAARDFVLLIGDDGPTPWTRRCGRGADELLLLADASAPAALHATETQYLMQRSGASEAAEVLVLLHPEGARCPRNTRAWLDRRPVTDHIHIRPALERDMTRLARVQSHSAIGLVLAGGGARGFAHLGVVRALAEQGIEIDCVGGTSIGAVMAALVASDRPWDDAVAIARRAFRVNPTGDFNFIPVLSLIKGRRLRRIISEAVNELLGFDANVEDLWKSYYCVASNYSQARETLIRRGNLVKSVLASIAIPGALPPVLHDGDLLCDGGTFNNFPADVMAGMRGVGTVIGVDLSNRKPRRIELDDVPSGWELLRDRLRPRERRRYRFPSLVAYLMNVTILYSSSRQLEAKKLTHLYFNPPLSRVGMLEWEKLDSIVEEGHAYALEVLGTLDPDKLGRFGVRPSRIEREAAPARADTPSVGTSVG
jgi:NTE family protein